MRLHRLEITAFGPFADTAEVDFDELGADGLFLLHGPTGAGKTTVLDAIAFALYGTVPGARREVKRLHSDHASAQTPPRVALEATIGGRRLRLERSPEFQRPKLRGSGIVAEKAKATLTWLDGRGQHLSRIPDITEEVNRLLGMSADQFFQVVLLPQGDFDRFLSADNEEREKLLERLFDTDRFGRAEHWLADQRHKGNTELEDRKHGIGRVVDQIVVIAGSTGTAAAEPRQADQPPDDPLEAVDWAQQLLTDTKAELVRADADVVVRQADWDRAAAALAEGRRLDELRRRRDAARLQRVDHEAGAARRRDIADELARARAAEPIQETLAEAETAASRVVPAEAESDAARRRLAAIDGGVEAAKPDSDLDAAVRGWSAEVGTLEAVAEDELIADRLDVELAELTAYRQERTTAADDLRLACAEVIPLEIERCERAVIRAREARAALPLREAELDVLRRLESTRRKMAERIVELDEARARAADARADHVDAREQVVQLRERRLAGMAAELAARLTTGEPCAVCGSTAHPAPARSTTATVTKQQEDDAIAAERAAGARQEATASAVAALEREIESLAAQSGDGGRDVSAEIAVATDELAETTRLAQEFDSWSTRLAHSRERQAAAQEQLRAAEAVVGALTERIATGADRLAELRARVVDAAGDDGAVHRRRDRLNQLVDAATALREARAAAHDAARMAAIAADRLDASISQAGFDSGAAATGALRTAQRLAEIEADLAAADRARAHADGVLAEPDILALPTTLPVDIAELSACADDSASKLQDAVSAQADAARRVTVLEDLAAQLWAAVDRIAPLQRRQDELAALAEVVAGRGENSRRMSLRSYVLAARLEEVALAGSVRLSRMSGGRYEFVHSDAAGPRGRRGGLGLDVRDDYTGAIRPSKTLSGGEKFMAALALALGLADTVAAESGGLILDTMFIDEGFGSLDSDALDRVMTVLDDLRAGGRVVGVVSHVDEMRQRIPSKLRIARGRNGSHVEVTSSGNVSGVTRPGM